MPKKTSYTFEVTISGSFPFDMLRYDRCYPASENESIKLSDDYRGVRTITLRGATPPTLERWYSFGAQLVKVLPF